MPLQLRRGPTADRLAITPLVGELVYDTTTQAVYIGDGVTAGGLPVTTFSIADSRSTTAKMFLGDSLSDNTVHNGITFALVGNRLHATVQQDLSNYIGLIAADQGFKGNLWADDSGLIVNSETHTVYGNFVPTGHVLPESNETIDLGSSTKRFRDLYLSGTSLYLGDAVITSTGTAVDLPLGSTIAGNPVGINEGDIYNIVITGNVIGVDSTVLVNTANGTFHGDLTGSVFADDSTLLVDGRDGVLRGQLIGSVSGNVTGNLTGNAASATVASTVALTATNSSALTHHIAFTLNATGDEVVRTDTNLTYQPSTNTLTLGVLSATTVNATTISASSFTGDIFASTIDTADSSGITVVPAVTFNSDVIVENELFIGGDVLPDTSETYNLGSYTRKFGKLYLTEGSNALWIGNAAISGSGTIIDLPAGSTVGGVAIPSALGSNAATITVNTTGINADHFIAFFDDQTGNNVIYTDDTFKYNPGTGFLSVGNATIGTVTGNLVGNVTGNVTGNLTGTVTGDLKGSVFADDSTAMVNAVDRTFNGDLTGNVTGNVTGTLTGNVVGNAATATTATEVNVIDTGSTNASFYVAFVDTQSGADSIRADSSLTYNPDSNTLTASTFNGNLSGNVTGSVTGDVITNRIDSADSSEIVLETRLRALSDIIVENEVIGKLSGDVYGNLYGDVYGNLRTLAGTKSYDRDVNVFYANGVEFIGGSAITSQTGEINVLVNDVGFTGNIFNVTKDGTYTGTSPWIQFSQYHNTPDADNLTFTRARGTFASPTASQSGDDIIDIAFSAFDGTAFRVAGAISVNINGAVSTNIVPTQMLFQTHGSTAGSNATRMSISSQAVTFVAPPRLPVYADDTARGNAIPSPLQGMMCFMVSGTTPAATNQAQVFDGTNWVNLT